MSNKYTDEEIKAFVKGANSDLGDIRYKPKDLVIDYSKSVIINLQLLNRIADLETQLALCQWKNTAFPPSEKCTVVVFNSGDTPSKTVVDFDEGMNLYELGDSYISLLATDKESE